MNNLKTARRSQMGNMLLRTLMIICSLGDEWRDVERDAAKRRVHDIVEEWRMQSKEGRYDRLRVGPCGAPRGWRSLIPKVHRAPHSTGLRRVRVRQIQGPLSMTGRGVRVRGSAPSRPTDRQARPLDRRDVGGVGRRLAPRS